MKTVTTISALAVAIAASTSLAFADPMGSVISAGSSVYATPLTFSYAGQPMNSSVGGSFSTSTIAGTYKENVVYDSSNVYNGQCSGPSGECLTFVLELDSSNPADSNGIEHITTGSATGFQNVATTVGYEVMNGPGGTVGQAPVTIDETPDGTISFNFATGDPADPGTPIPQGGFADYLVIDTNASNFVPGNFSLIDSTTATEIGFVPVPPSASPVPEPNSLVLLGSGLLGGAALLFMRRRSALGVL